MTKEIPRKQGKQTQRLKVQFDLEGQEAERFLAYMERQKIKLVSVVGRKLALERLDEVEAA